MIVWSEGSTSLWSSAKLGQSAFGENGLRGCGWVEIDGVAQGCKASELCCSTCRSIGERWLIEMEPALWLEDIDNEAKSEEKVHVRDCTFLLRPHWVSNCTRMAMHI